MVVSDFEPEALQVSSSSELNVGLHYTKLKPICQVFRTLIAASTLRGLSPSAILAQ